MQPSGAFFAILFCNTLLYKIIFILSWYTMAKIFLRLANKACVNKFMKYFCHYWCNNFSLAASAIGTVTKNYRLGFGSFVDKHLAPFVDVSL